MQELLVKEEYQAPGLADGYIFNSPEFQALKQGDSRYFVLERNGECVARIGFTIKGTVAISGYKATFGSVDCLPEVDTADRRYFIQQVTEMMAARDINEVIIRHRPQAYGDNWQAIFIGLGFEVIEQEVNQHLTVNKQDFRQRIKYNEQKKLKQAINAGYVFRQLTIDELPEVYALVADTRNRKGYPVSMQLPDLEAVFVALPDNYHLFGLYDKRELIAASVSVRVSAGVLYNFYHADAAAYRSTSPLVMLLAGIYRYCQQHAIKILDLGVSSENGVVNKGLFTFKQNLGCTDTYKNTYRLKL